MDNLNNWRPAWTKAAGYPDIKNTSMREWAWEFLRRNPEYQKDYQKLEDELEFIGFKKQRIEHEKAINEKRAENFLFDWDIEKKAWPLIEKIIREYKVERAGKRGVANPANSYYQEIPVFSSSLGPVIFNFFSESDRPQHKYMTRGFYVGNEEVFDSFKDDWINKKACVENKKRDATIQAYPMSLTAQISL